MTPIQPVGWWHYLRWQATTVPENLQHFSYLSWEDALWDLLEYFSYPKPSTILVPEFFCADVVENMETHGLQHKTYPLDKNLQADPKVFKKLLQEYQPQVVVILHAVGITNQLFAQKDVWLSALPKDTLLIEDSVHRVVNPAEISLISPRHIVLDSLRKVAPIPGTNLFGGEVLKELKPTDSWKTIPYQSAVLAWWMIFQCCLMLALLPNNRWKKIWNALAEKSMLRGYDWIGDNFSAASGNTVFQWLSLRLDHEKISRTKKTQVELYETLLNPLWKSPALFKLTFPESDFGNLRGYPVGLELQNAQQILTKMRSKSLLVRFELNDFGWTQKQKIVYLPLGPHVSESQIIQICEILENSL